MNKRQEALDNMRLQIAEDSKLPFWVPLSGAISMAVLALIFSTKDGYLFVTTLFLIFMNMLLVCTLATVITKTFLRPIVELWLAADSESAEEEKKTE